MTIILTIFNDKNQVFFSYSSSQTIKSLYQLATMQLQIFAVHIYYPFALKVTMFANANAMTTVGRRYLEALRLQPLGKPPQCFS